jgi:hypothetical protein
LGFCGHGADLAFQLDDGAFDVIVDPRNGSAKIRLEFVQVGANRCNVRFEHFGRAHGYLVVFVFESKGRAAHEFGLRDE